MAVLGEAWIVVRPKTEGFGAELASETDPAFAKMDEAAGKAGKEAGLKLKAGMAEGTQGLTPALTEAGGLGGLPAAQTKKEEQLAKKEAAVAEKEKVAQKARFGKGMDRGLMSVGALLGTVNPGMGKYTQHMSEATGKTGEFAKVGKFAVLGMAGAAVYAGMAGVKYQNMTSSLAAQAGITVGAANKIGNAFLQTAGHSVFSGAEMVTAYTGVAAQLASVQGKALTTGQAMLVMKHASDLAEASGNTLAQSSADLAKVMQGFGMKAKDAGMVTNDLFTTSKNTGLGLDNVASTFLRIHSTLGAFTPKMGQLGGLLVDLTTHGETGRQAMTALSGAMSGMLAPGTKMELALGAQKSAFQALSPHLQRIGLAYEKGHLSSKEYAKLTKGLTLEQQHALSAWKMTETAVGKAQDKLKSMGVTIMGAHGHFVGMAAVIAQLHKKIAGETEAQKVSTLTAVFGATAARKMLTVVEAGPKAYMKATKAVQAHHAAADAAAKKTRDLTHQFEIIKVAVEDFAVKLGQKLLPAITAVLGYLLKHKDILAIVAILIGTVLVTATAAWVVGLFAADGALGVLAVTLGLTMGELMLVIGVVVLLIAAGYELYKHWNTVWSFMKDIALDFWHFLYNNILHPIMEVFLAVFNFIKKYWFILAAILLLPFMPVIYLVVKFRKQIEHAFKWIIGIGKDLVKAFVDVVKAIAHFLAPILHIIFKPLLLVGEWMWDHVGKPIISFFKKIPGWITSASHGLFDGMKAAAVLAMNFLIEAWDETMGRLPGMPHPNLIGQSAAARGPLESALKRAEGGNKWTPAQMAQYDKAYKGQNWSVNSERLATQFNFLDESKRLRHLERGHGDHHVLHVHPGAFVVNVHSNHAEEARKAVHEGFTQLGKHLTNSTNRRKVG